MQIFPLSLWIVSLFSLHCLLQTKSIWFFKEARLIKCFFYASCLWYCILKVMAIPKYTFSYVVFWELLCFTFRLLIHLELIFVKSVRSESRLIFLYVQLFQGYLLRRLWCIVMPCSFVKNQVTISMWVYFWTFYSICLFLQYCSD